MKKTLLAAALLTGFAGAASAQSSVTLYGVVDIGIQYQNLKFNSNDPFKVKDEAKTSMTNVGLASGIQNGSRWGLKGVEDLGNGLKANFVYESGITATTGKSEGFTRQATVGLTSTTWGAVDLGRRTSPGTYAFSGIDPFGASFGTSALDSSFGTQFIRYSNMIMYTTPSFNGFTGSVGYSFDTRMTSYAPGNSGLDAYKYDDAPFRYETNNKQRAVSVGLRYANGPLLLGAAYDQINAPASLNLERDKVLAWMLGGTYDFKVVKLHAAYGQQVGGIIEGATTLSTAGFTGGDTNTRGGVLFTPGARTQSWMVGATAPIGAATRVFASVQQMLPGGNYKDGGASNQTVASIGMTYDLSKRTNLYGYYSYVNNFLMMDGVKSNTVAVGIRHRF